MNKYTVLSVLSLALLILALPIYAVRESERMAAIQDQQRGQYVSHATDVYLKNCSLCHGLAGEGLGVTPALNTPALAQADQELLFRKIAHPPHGSAMDAWHAEDGPNLNDYQVEGLVTLIRYPHWEQIKQQADQQGIKPPVLPIPDIQEAFVDDLVDVQDPHECVSCHEQPALHSDRFGLNCSRCHSLDGWTPALLVHHVFPLDHGVESKIACQTCHPESYAENTCYGCHDHQPDDMYDVHTAEKIAQFEDCTTCHPTGVEGEGGRYWEALVLQGGQQGRDQVELAPSAIPEPVIDSQGQDSGTGYGR